MYRLVAGNAFTLKEHLLACKANPKRIPILLLDSVGNCEMVIFKQACDAFGEVRSLIIAPNVELS